MVSRLPDDIGAPRFRASFLRALRGYMSRHIARPQRFRICARN